MEIPSIRSLQAELESVQTRNELALKAALLGTWDWNIETGEVFYNETWVRLLGYELDEVEFHVDGWMHLLHPDDIEYTSQILRDNISGKTNYYRNEHRLKMKSGEYLWVQARGCVVERDNKGLALKHTGVMLDISERKAQQQHLLDLKTDLEEKILTRTHELQASEKKISSILQLAPEGIITTSSDGLIQIFNEGAQKLFGYGAEEIIGKSLNILIHNSLSHKHTQYMKNFRDGKVNRIHMSERQDIKGYRKDGSSFLAKVSISKIQVQGDTIFTAIVHDISELINAKDMMTSAKETAEVANRAKTDFLANMSHELRTPLNAIIGYAQLIEQEVIGPIDIEDYKGYAGAIHSSGQHLLSLIQDILDISKIEAKKQELKEEALFLSPVVDACYMMTRESAINADISLTVTIAENLPDLYADEKSLKQIFLNLMSNAIKFTPAGGRVDLRIYLNETKNIVCEVVDSGIGLAKENIPKILLPFTQIENEDYPQGTREGTGLGLTIVKSFTDLYQAELSIDSEPNVGTSVKITFPKSRTMSR